MRKAHDTSQFSEGAIICRTMGHAWKPFTAERVKGGYNVTLQCQHGCGTWKFFQLSMRGEYGSPKYSYGDGYLATFTPTVQEKNAMRLEALSDYLKPDKIGKVG